MKQWRKAIFLAVPMTLTMAFSGFAGQWEEENITWKYQQDDGSYAADVWQWIDGDGNGTAECYHFNEDGFLDLNTVVDGWIVNSQGQWTMGGNVQQLDLNATAEEIGAIYGAANTKAAGLRDMDADINAVMKLTVDQESMDMLMDMNMKMQGAYTGNMKILYDMAIQAEGESVTMTMFYQDGYMYTETEGIKMKMPMDMDEILEQSRAMSSSLQLASDQMYGMDNMQLYRNGNAKTVTYEMNTAELNAAVNEIMALMGTDFTNMGYEYQVDRASGTIHINEDGYADKESVSMDMSMTVLGMNMDMTIDMDVTIKNPGQPVFITLPSTEGYADLTEM